MEIYILNSEFEPIGIIESFESFLWVDRYNNTGDFEIFTYADPEMIALIKRDDYLWFSESEHLMIVEEKEILTDIDQGAKTYFRGRSLESLLERRIVWSQTILTGNFQNAIEKLLNENAINPTDSSRKIPGLIFSPSVDPRITSLSFSSAQFTGDYLYDAIKLLCDSQQIGFKIVLDESNRFVFSLFAGVDRSYSQDANPYVVFAPEFDNIINSNYFETNRLVRTAALIAGEGEGNERITATIGGGQGLDRRELFIDARDISSETEDGVLTPEEYEAQLIQRGVERMADYQFIKTFEGEMESSQMFIYGKDFGIGDVVQVLNEFGIEAKSRIMEMIFSYSEEGISRVPTFQIVE